MKINAIIAAGGNSVRYGKNKLFEPLGSSNIIMETVKKFVANDRISRIVIAIKSENVDEMIHFFDLYKVNGEKVKYAQSGESRSKSVENAFISLEDDCNIVLVHDAARPFVSPKLIDEIIDTAQMSGAAVPCVALNDSIISADSFPMSQSREQFRLVQTPQAFDLEKLKLAYSLRTRDFSDDFGVYETFGGGSATLIQGEKKNIKITTPDDLKTVLTGCGYDIHRFKSGNGLRLGGVTIPFDRSFDAHSDGDVLIHSIMDAMLTAAGEKDIGHYFSTTDKKFEGANSMELLKKIKSVLSSKSLFVVNVSSTIIAEKPMLSPYIDLIRQSIADALDLNRNKVGLSATTNEKVGEIGDGNAIACYSSVLLSNS